MGCEKPRVSSRSFPEAFALYPTPISSSFFSKPSETPIIMLFTIDLVVPAKAIDC